MLCYVAQRRAEGGTSLDEVVSARVHPGGHVFSKGLHCRREQPGFIFIRNACPGAVALTFEVRVTALRPLCNAFCIPPPPSPL